MSQRLGCAASDCSVAIALCYCRDCRVVLRNKTVEIGTKPWRPIGTENTGKHREIGGDLQNTSATSIGFG